ncbi:hypothetical protein AB0J42_34760 [Nonomuraea sp. NPDC049649]|uniref:hypothetical protein n=1 Tax=Nonomuraea sp. NPDC049649 TaxID=3155776 RepID=UPI00342EDA8D
MTHHLGKLFGAALLGTLLTACSPPAAGDPQAAQHGNQHGGQHGQHAGHHGAPPAPGKTATVASIDQLGAALGCPGPKLQIDAAELRQAACKTSTGHSILVTFTTGKNQRDWLDAAQPYGGTYLVGDRWVVVSEPPVLEGLRAQLGGRIESGDQHH